MSADVFSLDDLRSAAQERYGDYHQAYGPEPEQVAVLRHFLRLGDADQKSLLDVPQRISAVQDDPPEVEAARKKLNAAQNRLDSLSEDAPGAVREQHEKRVADEQAKVDAAVAEHGPNAAEQMGLVRGVVHDMIRTAVADQRHADGLIEALGTDVSMHLLLVERYMKRAQAGEAQPSGA